VAGKAQARERDGHLHLIASICDPPGDVIDEVVAQVLAAVVGPEQVPLDAVGVRGDLVGPDLVAEGVQAEDHVVVRPDAIPLGQGRAHTAWVVIADERDVEVLVIEGQERLRVHRRLDLVPGRMFGEVAGAGGADPAGVIQQTVNVDRPGDPDGCQLGVEGGGEGCFRAGGWSGRQQQHGEQEYAWGYKADARGGLMHARPFERWSEYRENAP
jgi:hypothetical protein